MKADKMIPLARPDLNDDDRSAVADVLSLDVLSRGPALASFEHAIAQYLGVNHAVGVSSGTAAIHLALMALDIRSGDQVITVPFTVPATVNAILASGAKPVFVDVEEQTRGMSPEALESAMGPRTRAVVLVHAFGQPARTAEIRSICDQARVPLIEDACEGLGSRTSQGYLGTLGQIGCFGFYPNKQITTGEGGMLVTNDAGLANRARILANHGRSMDGSWTDQIAVGMNYRLSEIQAALGASQTARLPSILAARRQVADWYHAGFSNIQALDLPPAWRENDIAWFALVALMKEDLRKQRDEFVEFMNTRGIQCGRYFAPLHLQPALKGLAYRRGDFPVTENLGERAVALPYFSKLTEDEVATVCRAAGQWLSN